MLLPFWTCCMIMFLVFKQNYIKLVNYNNIIYFVLLIVIQNNFVLHFFKLFHDLHWNTAHDRTEILREGEYKWIYKLLSKCTKSAPVFEPIMSKCKDVVRFVRLHLFIYHVTLTRVFKDTILKTNNFDVINKHNFKSPT